MATNPPRILVRDHWLAKLAEITTANGYRTDIKTVELKKRLLRDLNISDCPAILISFVDYRVERPETVGHNEGNSHFRGWAMVLELAIKDPGDKEIMDVGEFLFADVEKCLIKNRFNNGKPFDVSLIRANMNEFERIQNEIAIFKVEVVNKLDFTLQDL